MKLKSFKFILTPHIEHSPRSSTVKMVGQYLYPYSQLIFIPLIILIIIRIIHTFLWTYCIFIKLTFIDRCRDIAGVWKSENLDGIQRLILTFKQYDQIVIALYCSNSNFLLFSINKELVCCLLILFFALNY